VDLAHLYSPGRITSNPADSDAYNIYYPWHVYLGRELAAGRIPLWDPTRFAGAPYAADPSTATFYPLNWLYALGNPLAVTTFIWAVTLLASLLLTFWFLCTLRLHPLAGALGAIVWTFGGFMMSWAMFDSYIASAVWLPMVLGGFELARRGTGSRVPWGVPIAGLGLALSLLGGQFQITLYLAMSVAIWAAVATGASAWAVRGAGRGPVLGELARGAAVTAGAFGIAGGLAAAQILGALEYAPLIARQKETVAFASAVRLLPRDLPTLLLPQYLGNPRAGTYPGIPYGYLESTFYVGVLSIPLAVAGCWHRNRRLSLAFALMVLVGAGAAFATPLFHVLFALVPGINRTRSITRFKLLIDFGLAGLAALGLDAMLRQSTRTPQRVFLSASGAAAVTVTVLSLSGWATTLRRADLTSGGIRAILEIGASMAIVSVIARSRSRSLAAAVVLIAVVGADLWWYGFAFHPLETPGVVQPYPVTAGIAYLRSVTGPRPRYVEQYNPLTIFPLPPDASMVYGLYSINGYDPFIPANLVALLALVQPAVRAAAVDDTVFLLPLGTREPPILDLLGVRSVVSPPGLVAPGRQALSGHLSIFDETSALPPAFLAGCWAVRSDAAAGGMLKSMTDSDLHSTAVVAPGPGARHLGASRTSCRAGPTATLGRYQPEEVTVSVPASPGGILVLSDGWDPGWTATVDGRPAPVLRVDEALRGVAVGPGAHRVEFRYQPHWPLEGLAATLLTIVIITAWLTFPRKHATPGNPYNFGASLVAERGGSPL
jgi:hypothetical protein